MELAKLFYKVFKSGKQALASSIRQKDSMEWCLPMTLDSSGEKKIKKRISRAGRTPAKSSAAQAGRDIHSPSTARAWIKEIQARLTPRASK